MYSFAAELIEMTQATGNYPELEMMHAEVVKAEGQPAPHHLNSGRRPIGDEGHCLHSLGPGYLKDI